jgi:hypothetical protein
MTLAPDQINRLVADLADQPRLWDRDALVHTIGHRLTDADRRQLAETTEPAVLLEAMAATGVLAPATMLRVLRAEGVTTDTATALIPAIGMTVPDAIRTLHDQWGADRLDSAVQLNATVEELRQAGCSPTELLAAAPRETLRTLDGRESTWMRVGPAVLEAGYTPSEAVAHVAAHAPTPETFAAAVTTIVDDAVTALAYAACHARSEDLAALTERHGLTPHDAAAAFAAAGVPRDRAIEAVHLRCDHDVDATYELATGVLGVSGHVVTAILADDMPTAVAFSSFEVVDDLVGVDNGLEP